MRENGWVPVRALEQSIRTEARRGFQKHVVRFARGEHLQTWEKNQVRPEVVLVNSHDKSSAYRPKPNNAVTSRKVESISRGNVRFNY